MATYPTLNEERDMNKTTAWTLTLLLGSFAGLSLAADGGATKDDAVSMVKKGVAYIKANPHEKAYADISDKANTSFHHQDLYLVVYALDGTVKAHGANAKMVGKNLIDLKDIDGKPFVKERVDMAKTQASFWQDYKFTNPENKKIEPKSMYCEKLDDTVVCGGIYK
jgi:cytochrome c